MHPDPPRPDSASTGRSWSRSPALRASAVAVVLWAGLLGSLTVGRNGGDPRGFLCLGARFDHPPALAGAPRTSPWGYDGQFYAILATDPLMLESSTARALDTPGYRGRRILLPFAAWVLVLGHPQSAPFVYLLLCWIIGLTGVGLLAHWLQRDGASPWLALLYAASGGLVVSFVRGTPDAATTTMILAGLWVARSQRLGGATGALAAAAMTRETAVLAAFAQGLVEVQARHWWRGAVLAGVPLLTIAAWTGWLALRFGLGSGGGLRNFTLPFAAASGRVHLLLTGQLNAVEALGLLAVLASIVAAAALIARGERNAATLALGAFSALAVVLGPAVWEEVYASLRVLGVLPALSLVCLAGPKFRGRRPLLLAGPVLATLAGLILIRIELVPMIPALGNLKGLAASLLGSLASLLQ